MTMFIHDLSDPDTPRSLVYQFSKPLDSITTFRVSFEGSHATQTTTKILNVAFREFHNLALLRSFLDKTQVSGGIMTVVLDARSDYDFGEAKQEIEDLIRSTIGYNQKVKFTTRNSREMWTAISCSLMLFATVLPMTLSIMIPERSSIDLFWVKYSVSIGLSVLSALTYWFVSRPRHTRMFKIVR